MTIDEKRAHALGMSARDLALTLETAAIQARDGYTDALRTSATETRDVLREEIARRIETATNERNEAIDECERLRQELREARALHAIDERIARLRVSECQEWLEQHETRRANP